MEQNDDFKPGAAVSDDVDMDDVEMEEEEGVATAIDNGDANADSGEEADEEADENADGEADGDEREDVDENDEVDADGEASSDVSEVDPPHSKRKRELPQLSEDKNTITYKTVYGDDDPNDPIVAEYNVYLNDESELEYYLLQYMDRDPDQPTSAANNSLPTEVRVKRDAGFMEIDVPLDVHTNYDRTAGVRYGEAMRKTKALGQQAYGLAGGFEKKMPKRNTSGGANEDEMPVHVDAEDDSTIQEYVENFEDANAKGHVLNTKTYGGRIYKEPDWKPLLYVGAFRGDELHLTPLSGTVQLQVQVNHVDAVSQLEAVNRRREKESTEPAKTAEAKTFMPTIKKAAAETSVEQIQSFLKRTAEEPWLKLRYHDEDSLEAYDAYEKLFVDKDKKSNPHPEPSPERNDSNESPPSVKAPRVFREGSYQTIWIPPYSDDDNSDNDPHFEREYKKKSRGQDRYPIHDSSGRLTGFRSRYRR